MIILRQKYYAATNPTTPAGGGNTAGGVNFFNKVGNFAKDAWNGNNLTGNKTGNRAAIIGAGAVATLGTAALINNKRKEKEERERRGY